MRIEVEDIIHQPASIVFPLVRDEMEKIVPYMPDIQKIDVLKKEQVGEGRLEIVNDWYSKPPDVPAMMKKFIKPEMYSWKDYALWKDEEWCVDYRLESKLANDLFDARGTNYFEPEGEDKTRVRVTCNIEIYPEKLPGVPGFLAKKVRPTIEDLIRKMLEPNLSSLTDGLTRYFDDPANRPD